MAQVGFEPTASLVLSEGGLPIAYRADSGRRGSRTLKAYRSTVFETAAIASWLALPLRAAVAGIEPAGYAFNRRAHTTNSSPTARGLPSAPARVLSGVS